jgi:hypothetical protein
MDGNADGRGALMATTIAEIIKQKGKVAFNYSRKLHEQLSPHIRAKEIFVEVVSSSLVRAYPFDSADAVAAIIRCGKHTFDFGDDGGGKWHFAEMRPGIRDEWHKAQVMKSEPCIECMRKELGL